MRKHYKSKNTHIDCSKIKGITYLLIISIKNAISLKLKTLGQHVLPAGIYLYVGSARGSIKGRILRHLKISREKIGKPHWHIDYILLHRNSTIINVLTFSGISECELSRAIAESKHSSVPIYGFGSSDCREKCPAHFFKVNNLEKAISSLRKFLD